MRALILVAGAALAVSACSSNDAADNTMNVDENLTTNDMNDSATMNIWLHKEVMQHLAKNGGKIPQELLSK